jgi:NTP pyrophosphatase (non-canonical NTP hydrolase)
MSRASIPPSNVEIITPEDYTELARRTRTTQTDPAEIERAKANAALGLTGEAGEVADVMKKELFHRHDAHPDKIEEELGDLLWYASWVADLYGLTLTGCMQRNVDKLRARYPAGFRPEDSRNRVK